MLKLPNVTLVALSGIGYQSEENANALKKSCEGVEWGAVKYIQLGNITDINSWNKAVIYDLHKYIDTEFAMFVHGDGFVVNPDAWQDEFLAYDFIGAPWPLPQDDYSYRTPSAELVRVGNSVSIRSKKLLRLPSEMGLPWKSYYGNTNEDGFLCVHNRERLINEGIRFAPLDVAKYFSREHTIPENLGVGKTFAFHTLDL